MLWRSWVRYDESMRSGIGRDSVNESLSLPSYNYNYNHPPVEQTIQNVETMSQLTNVLAFAGLCSSGAAQNQHRFHEILNGRLTRDGT